VHFEVKGIPDTVNKEEFRRRVLSEAEDLAGARPLEEHVAFASAEGMMML